jgi:CDP-glycerol glycerophosphotransferase
MASESLVSQLPDLQRSESYCLRLGRLADGTVDLWLGPPLRDDERGPRRQERLARWYAGPGHQLARDEVYFQAYAGQVTDSPLAVHEAVRRLRPELRTCWAVADSSVVTPQGADRVLIGSREWYGALARAGHIVTNVDLEEWFVKRPGQRVLQTYHGYPSKAMGISAWELKGATPKRVERQLQRTSGTWDLLLAPTPAMEQHYRTQYRYAGPVLSHGYPRDDVLVGAEAAPLRAAARDRLRLGDRTAVLWAPTWRDDENTGFREAPMTSVLDADDLARALGPAYVVLLRGHRFHRRRSPSERVLDVTEYPEINDLVLACDAAVLDYSSLRFDLVLVDTPMVFLVPDLVRYEGRVRGFLHDFAASAPGPLLQDQDAVVAELRDLDGLRERTRPARESVRAQFQSLQDGQSAERTVQAFFGPRPRT